MNGAAANPALNNPVIGHNLEHLTIDGVAQRLGFRPRAAEAFGPLLEFDANPFDVDGPILPVPGDAFHAHVRQIAAETAVTLYNHRLDAGPRRADRGGEASRSAADNQYIRLGHNRSDSRRLRDLFHGARRMGNGQAFPRPALAQEWMKGSRPVIMPQPRISNQPHSGILTPTHPATRRTPRRSGRRRAEGHAWKLVARMSWARAAPQCDGDL